EERERKGDEVRDGEPGEERGVPVRDRAVERDLGQPWADELERCAGEEHGDGGGDSPAVRAQVPQEPPHEAGVVRFAERFFFVDRRPGPAHRTSPRARSAGASGRTGAVSTIRQDRGSRPPGLLCTSRAGAENDRRAGRDVAPSAGIVPLPARRERERVRTVGGTPKG